MLNYFKRVSKTTSFFAIFCLLVPSVTIPIQIKTTKGINFRDENLNRVVYLPPNTVIKIPDKFIPKKFTEKDKVIKPIEWLKTVGPARTFKRKKVNGKLKNIKGFFAEAKIISIPGKKYQKYVGTSGNIGIRYLRKIRDEEYKDPTFKYRTGDNTPFIPKEPKEKIPPKKSQTVDTVNCNENCSNHINILDRETQKYKETYAPLIDKLGAGKTMAEVDRTVRNTIAGKGEPCRDMEKEFNKRCSPPTYKNFTKTLYKKCSESKIPPELMMGILTQESFSKGLTSLCNADGKEGSIGLFQIHLPSYNFKEPQCKELGLSPAKCLRDPLINLDHAIKILIKKYKWVNDKLPKSSTDFSELSSKHRNKWRKALSGYNGGQGYVFQAYHDIKAFNKKHGTKYDAQDWDIRRVFMFRNHIDQKVKDITKKVCRRNGRRVACNRKLENAITNVAYVESIMGRENSTQPGHITKWSGYFDKEPFSCPKN